MKGVLDYVAAFHGCSERKVNLRTGGNQGHLRPGGIPDVTKRRWKLPPN